MNPQFFDYAEHLCQILHCIDNHSFKDKTCIQLVQKEKFDYFIQHLYVFHQCLYINSPRFNKYKSELQELYDSIELHHYTNIDALEQIIRGHSLKLGQITKMNDHDEAMALIKSNMSQLYKYVSEHNCISKLGKLIYSIETYASELYSFSFSTRGNDVAQWERYGKKKDKNTNTDNLPCGVCIKIPMKKLREKIEGLKSRYEVLEIVPIVYTQDYAQDNPILKLITEIALSRTDLEINSILMKSGSSFFTIDEMNALHQLRSLFLYRNLTMYSAQVKHDSFSSESEIRLLVRGNICKPFMNDHILLDVGNFNDLISSIMIGPRADHIIEGRVAALLKKHNLDKTVKIEKRRCPLRT